MVWWIATLVQVGIYVGTALLSALLNRNSRQTNTPGEPQFPKADAQAPVPVVYGTTRVGINVVYKARVTTGENTVRNGALSFGWSSTHIGYFYYLDLLATVCHGPVDCLHEIYVDGTKKLSGVVNRVPLLDSFGVSYTPTDAVSPNLPVLMTSSGPWDFTITAGDLLGGKLSRGGIGAGGDGASTGHMRFQPGTGFLVPDSALETLAGTDLPVYPDICTVAFEDNFYFGNSEQLPGIEFVVSRTASWAPGMGTGYIGNNTANAGHGANPSAVLYDLLTNTTYGLGLPATDIDSGSFVSLAHATDQGLDAGAAFNVPISFVLTDGATGKQVVGDLLRTLDGVLYTDPETGLLCVRLLRDTSDSHYGYDIFDEVLIGEDVIRSLEWSESAPDAQVNEVVVEFTDRARDFTKNTVTARNVAAIQALGRVESRTVSFLGVQEADLAMRLAQRELRSLSTSLGHATIEVDRTGYLLTPGQFFTLNWSPRGISGRIMRVVEVRDSANGGVTIQAVEDIYSSPAISFEVETTPEPTPVDAADFVVPRVETDFTVIGGLLPQVLYHLTVFDPEGCVTAVEYFVGEGAPTGWADASFYKSASTGPGPYDIGVDRSPYISWAAFYRVSYTARDGSTQYIIGRFPDVVNDGTTLASMVGAGTGAATTLGQIGVPVQFVNVTEDDQWLALSTIPTAETEVGPEYRQQSYAVGVGSVRIGANVKTLTGTPTIGALYSLDGFGSVASLTSFAPGGTGVQYSGWVAMPSAAKADIGVTWSVANGADTAALDLYRVWLEYVPATVSGAREHSDEHAPEYS